MAEKGKNVPSYWSEQESTVASTFAARYKRPDFNDISVKNKYDKKRNIANIKLYRYLREKRKISVFDD